jgi:hypothetical protein
LIVSIVALLGVTARLYVQSKNFTRQVRSANALKIAEMRQQRINNLRDAMSAFQSYGVTPDLDHQSEREFYAHGTKIELMMNPQDPNFPELQSCMYRLFGATTVGEKYAANPAYVDVCQRILKAVWEVLKRELAASQG